MKRKTAIRWVKSLLFLALLTVCVAAVSSVLERKASGNKLRPFLERAGEHDVLFIGDSHMLNGVFPMELWRDYGIAAYNLGSTGSTLPVTYWTLMNALDYMQPQVVVVGVKDVEKRYKLSGSSGDVHVALDAFPLTATKARAIEDLMDDPYAVDDDGNAYAEMKWEYYFPLGKYHARWSEISETDFRPRYNFKKGAETMIGVAVPNDYDIIDENWAAEEYGEGFAYLRMIIETCQSRGIGVMLVHLPYPSREEEQMAANAVYYIAEEYGVGYVDFVNLDQVVDYDADCFDAYSHLNPSGAMKVTDFIGRYLTDHFDLPDRRQHEGHAQWHADYAAYLADKTDVILSQTNLHNLLMLLHDSSYGVSLCVEGGSDVYMDETAMRLVQNIAREHIYEEDAFAKWSNALFPLELLDEAAAEGAPYFMAFDPADGETVECVGAQAEEMARQTFTVQAGECGVRVLLRDAKTGELLAQTSL